MKNIKTIFTRDIIPYFLWVPRHQAASAMMGATFAAAASPLPALAARVEEEDEGFDLRILAVPRIPSRMEGLSLKNGALMVILSWFQYDLIRIERGLLVIYCDFMRVEWDLVVIFFDVMVI